MYDQLRLEKYGLCCKMKVTTVVHILGWVGIVSSILEGLIALILPTTLTILGMRNADGNKKYITIFWVLFLIYSPFFLYSLIIRSILLKRNRARNFSGVKIIMKIICQSYLSLHLIVGLIMLIIGILGLLLPTNVEATSFIDKSEDLAATELPKLTRIFMVVYCIFWSSDLIFTCIGIHGVRKNRKNLINALIIINIIVELVLFTLFFSIYFSRIFKQYSVSLGVTATIGHHLIFFIIGTIYLALLLSYFNGHFAVVYNMIDVSEEYEHEMRRV